MTSRFSFRGELSFDLYKAIKPMWTFLGHKSCYNLLRLNNITYNFTNKFFYKHIICKVDLDIRKTNNMLLKRLVIEQFLIIILENI